VSPTSTGTQPHLPPDLDHEVRTHAAALPTPPYQLDRVRARGRAYRRRRAGWQAAAAVLAAAAVTLAVPAVHRVSAHRAATPAPATSAPRLLLYGASTDGSALLPGNKSMRGMLPVPPVVPEMKPDGTVVLLSVSISDTALFRVKAMPDGRLAALDTTDAGDRLMIFRPDGTPSLSRDLAGGPKGNGLVAVSNTDVYLSRGDAVYAHDIATGAERKTPYSRPQVLVADANAIGLVIGPVDAGAGACATRLVDPHTGAVKVLNPPVRICSPFTVRLSPDGRYLAALVPLITTTQSNTRLYILDVATGRTVKDYPVVEKGSWDTALAPYAGEKRAYRFANWGWTGPTTVTLAAGVVQPGEWDKLGAALKTRTFTV
jgi:hypothetical protein